MLQPRLIEVEPVCPMMLLLHYETGEIKLFDVAPYATGSWYGKLRDKEYFSTVRLLPNGAGVEWPDGQDIALHELYEGSTMSEIAMNAARMLNMLPEEDQNFAMEFIKKLVLAWDPDFTKVTPDEATEVSAAENSVFIADEEIDWDNLSQYAG